MFNVTLFRRNTFNLLCLGTIILFVWFIVPYFYLAEHMIYKGYSEDDGAVMLSVIGITNTIGMVRTSFFLIVLLLTIHPVFSSHYKIDSNINLFLPQVYPITKYAK